MDELINKFRHVAFTCTFLGGSKTQIDAKKVVAAHRLDLETLAKFHYLLPHDLVFEYQEKPQMVHRDKSPETLLVFEFLKKRPPSPKLVEKRIEKFQAALQQFCSRRNINELDELAKVPREPQLVKIKDGYDEVTLETILNYLEGISVAVRVVPPKPAIYSAKPVSDKIQEIMTRKGMEKLYIHQHEAIEHLDQGHNVVVSTPTASGKSFIFQAPVISALEQDISATALFIYPTKALAQDQLQIFQKITDVECGTFDGDTEMDTRETLKRDARVLFSNPDILHCTVLPNWSNWESFLAELRFVVIDEIHLYKGVFGAHVALILRRMRRMCYQLGNDTLKFICCSATVHNPLHFANQLTGVSEEEIRLVHKDGSPSSQKHYFFVQAGDQDDPKHSGHPIRVAAPIFVKLVSLGLKTIAFCKFRKSCELLMKSIRFEVLESAPELVDGIRSYRGGYNKEERRRVEQDMFENRLKGIVSTSALEVGIDIGSLDAVVLCGLPSSMSSLRQQVGRVGRRDKDSIVVYVAGGEMADMTYIRNPDWIFTAKDPEIPLALLPSLIDAHLQCSARELTLSKEDFQFFQFDDLENVISRLDKEDDMYYCHAKWLPHPTRKVNIRHIEEQSTAIVDITDNRNLVIENIESFRVGFTVYPGGIYFYQGRPYLVVDLEENLLYAKVIETNVKWTTRQRDFTDVDPIKAESSMMLGEDYPCMFGDVKITTVVFGFFKFDERNRIIEAHDLTLPPVIRQSSGMWINLPTRTLDALHEKKLHGGGAIHGAEHAILKAIPYYVAVAAGDIGTDCKAPEKELAKRFSLRQRPARLIFYQRFTGTEVQEVWQKVYSHIKEIIDFVLNLIDSCPCTIGCSKCVGNFFCSENNIAVSKLGAQVIFRLMKGLPIDDIPDGPEAHLAGAQVASVVPVNAV